MIIYKHTSPSGKSYIGLTKFSIDDRLNMHKNEANKGSKFRFHQAIRKYGIENFTSEILEECVADIADEREIFWISFYDSHNHGYNMTKGGYGRNYKWYHTDESKLKMSLACIGRTPWNKDKKGAQVAWNKDKKLTEDQKKNMGHLHTEEDKLRMSEIHTGKVLSEAHKEAISYACAGEKNGMFGKTQSDDTKKKMSEKAKARKKVKCSYCTKEITVTVIKKHEVACKRNLETLTELLPLKG